MSWNSHGTTLKNLFGIMIGKDFGRTTEQRTMCNIFFKQLRELVVTERKKDISKCSRICLCHFASASSHAAASVSTRVACQACRNAWRRARLRAAHCSAVHNPARCAGQLILLTRFCAPRDTLRFTRKTKRFLSQRRACVLPIAFGASCTSENNFHLQFSPFEPSAKWASEIADNSRGQFSYSSGHADFYHEDKRA